MKELYEQFLFFKVHSVSGMKSELDGADNGKVKNRLTL